MFKRSIKQRAINFTQRGLSGPFFRFLFTTSGLSKYYKFLGTNSTAIGHLCVDVDCFLKERELRHFRFKGVLLANRRFVANSVIAKLWGLHQGILLIENPLACFLLEYLCVYPETSYSCSKYCALEGAQPAEAYAIYKALPRHEPVIFWDNSLYIKGKNLFARLFPKIDVHKVVLLHSRDSTFDIKIKNHNFFQHNHRNSDIKSYTSILNFLKLKNYPVIRIGEYNTKTDINSFHYHELNDLCRTEKDLISVYMASQCALFLGSSSGAFHLATIWNRPIFLLNNLPYFCLRPFAPSGMAIPKLLYLDNRLLSVSEIFEKKIHLFRTDQDYEKHGVKSVCNAPEDCLDDFIDFFNAFVLGNVAKRSELISSQYQKAYRNICPRGSFDYEANSLIPKHFFRKYDLVWVEE